MANEHVIPHDCVILDACCVINLYESGIMGDLLASLQTSVVVADYVYQEEVLPEEKGRLLTLQPLIDNGLLAITSLESEDEMNTFVNFAAAMDDGEAATGAIAVSRNWSLATDDQRAIKFLRQNAASIEIVSTLDLLKHWVDTVHPSIDTIRLALENIRTHAHYVPRLRHPLFGWWERHIRT